MADFLAYARKYLVESDEFQCLVDLGYVGADTGLSGPWQDGWLFLEGLFVQPEGTSKSAVVMNSTRGWAAPSQAHTDVCPTLEFKIYADPNRDPNRFQSDRTGRQRAKTVAQVLDRKFHDPANLVSDFAGYPILSTLKGTEWTYSEVPDGDGMVIAMADYSVWCYV